MTSVYIGLGSNLKNPHQQLIEALASLVKIPNSFLLKTSSFYQSKPFGPVVQPDFINAVVLLETILSPIELLLELQKVEQAHGRVRRERWGPRTLDLDILLYGDMILDIPSLQIPHPGLKQRSFVLYPLAEIAPNLVLPNGETLASLLQKCPFSDIKKL